MKPLEIALIAVFTCVIGGLLTACCIVLIQILRGDRGEPRPRRTLKEWWAAYKPSKRRLIQVYAALLTNANLKGYFTGRIYSGDAKYLCAPGLNCYSCPAAAAACPLGALQNALASSGTRAPYYVFGILLLFCVLLARTICGFLCPFGLLQDLLYKISTPKLKKSRATRALSYLKYVILALFAVSIPIMFGLDSRAVPAFCKYICPAGTLGGAVGLLIHPDNASLYGMLGGLFSWKFLILILVLVACVFIFRGFCRFLCPLGALYGLFNRISLLGVKLDENKCTDCGLCVSFCKMDISKVGDRECIQCGECISVCPAKAISFKGSKLFVHANAIPDERPLGEFLAPASENAAPMPASEAIISESEAPMPVSNAHTSDMGTAKPPKKKVSRNFVLQAVAWGVAIAVLLGALIYYNFLAEPTAELSDYAATHYFLAVSSRSGEEGPLSFEISEGGSVGSAVYTDGDGSAENPYMLRTLAGEYTVDVAAGETVYFVYEERGERTYTVTPHSEDLALELYYHDAALTMSEPVTLPVLTISDGALTPRSVSLSPVSDFGNAEGDLCFDFALDTYFGKGTFSLHEMRGKVVLINFWYTQCGPCVEEMPTLSEMGAAHPEDLVVVAVHSRHMYEDPATPEGVQAWLDRSGWQAYSILFAQDVGAKNNQNESFLFAALGGKDSYPMSVVVDRDGKIAFTRVGGVDSLFRSRLERLLAE